MRIFILILPCDARRTAGAGSNSLGSSLFDFLRSFELAPKTLKQLAAWDTARCGGEPSHQGNPRRRTCLKARDDSCCFTTFRKPTRDLPRSVQQARGSVFRTARRHSH